MIFFLATKIMLGEGLHQCCSLTLHVLDVLEKRMSTSSLKRFGSLLTHCGKVEELALGVVL